MASLFRTFWLLMLATAAFADAVSPPTLPPPTHRGAGQTIYVVMPDRFANGDRTNDNGGIPGGPEISGFDPTRIGYFHGGDFPGLTGKLDYIQGLHVSTVWTTPPFRNNPVQNGSAGYHGYWITDFENIDPHFGTNADYREFVRQAHAHGLRVYLDIVVNHTGDIIQYEGGKYAYIDTKTSPTRTAEGQPFDERAAAYNGLNDPDSFPRLSAEKSFPYRPFVPAGREHAKNPAWLNDVTLYHNRGNSLFTGESATRGDFAGLDDLMTEHPRVVRGFIDVFGHWLDAEVDGFRIDTMRHVNAAFWQAFLPSLRTKARARGRPDFIQFGEVMNGSGDVSYLAEFSTGTMPADATTDFPFAGAARGYVSQGGPATALSAFFLQDDRYTDHDSNVHASVTLLGNYDIARWGYFLEQDNPGASREQMAALVRLGHGLLYLVRGMPALHYGDEQGMVGRGGGDMQAREDMFASQAPDYRDAPLLATSRTGAEDKFDTTHPFYRFFAALGRLRQENVALRTGAMILRSTAEPAVFAFSRIDRRERVEYVAAFNNSRATTITASVPTSQARGSRLTALFDSASPDRPALTPLTAGAGGMVEVTLAPLQFAVWRADRPLAAPAESPTINLVAPAPSATWEFSSREFDDLILPSRREIRAEVSGGDGVAEVSFFLARASRPNQWEFLGTDDAPPYRIYWTPPADLDPGETLTFIATVNDLRGHVASARVEGIHVTGKVAFGIAGAHNPTFTGQPPAEVQVPFGGALRLTATATGSGDLDYQWYQDGEPIPGANAPTYLVPAATTAHGGTYRVAVHNLAGTTVSTGTQVKVGTSRLVRWPAFPSRFVAPRTIEIWLPPGYDAHSEARYPVIYLHDGQNLFDPRLGFGGNTWALDVAMQQLIERGVTRGAILVGLWNNGFSRFAEYFPQKAWPTSADVPLEVGDARLAASAIASDDYLRFIVTELKPFIDRTYRTQPDRAHTGIMGSSMGGLISAYAMAEYPDVFGGAACVSTHWPAGQGAVIDYLAQHLPKAGEHRIYFDFGTATLDASYEPFQQRMDAGLRALGYTTGRDWVTRKFPGAEHSEKSWRERAGEPLSFLLQTP